MVDKAEIDNGGKELEALKAEIAKQTAEQIKAEFIRMSLRAGELKTQIDNKLALEGKAPDKFEGEAADKDSAKGKAVDVKKEIKKILLTGKTTDKLLTPEGKSKEVTELAKTIIKKISVELDPEKMDITESSSPYLYSFLSKVIEGKIASIDSLQEEFKNLSYLAGVNRDVYGKVHDALIEVAKTQGYSEEQAKDKFKTEEKKTEPKKEEKPKNSNKEEGEYSEQEEKLFRELKKDSFDRDWADLYINYFDGVDYNLIKGFYDPEFFINNYVAKVRTGVVNEFGAKGESLHIDDIGKEVSKRIAGHIASLYGKLYTKLDLENPKDFFENIEQQDIFKGIGITHNYLARGLNGLQRYMEQHDQELKDKLGNMKFWKNAEEKMVVEDIPKKDSKELPHEKTRFRLAKLPKEMTVSGREFIDYLRLVVDNYREARRYTHNARAIFFQPPDHERGFYAQLGEYAEKMRMIDLDEMFLLPDADIFEDALRLYDKFVEEQFAFQDWKHVANMFTPQIGSHLTALEDQVLEGLKMMHSNDPNMTEGRLRAALSMAVGASRGIFLNEVEKAAFADPHLTEDGKATFVGYHTFDSAPLTAFNPMHQFYRWQAERTLYPILFLPVEGLKESVFGGGPWDHKIIWEKMKDYRESFLTGRKDLGKNVLFADFLNNISSAGGPLKRKSWRTEYQLNNLFVYKEDKTTLDYTKTWQVLENIGYETLSDFVDTRLPANFLKEDGPAKQELFKYLYGRYFGNKESLNDYLNQIRPIAEKVVSQEIMNKNEVTGEKRFTDDIKKEIELETTKIFLYRTLSRVVMQRIPTKVLRIERDRDTQDGVRRWKKIKTELGCTSEQMDIAMKDLLLAESMLRTEVSQKMRSILKEQPDKQKDMSKLGSEIPDYKLDKDKVRSLLEKAGLNMEPEKQEDWKVRVDRAVTVYEKINNTYGFGQKSEEALDNFAKFIKNKQYKYTFALDEVDLSFIPFRGGGDRVLPRLIKDMSTLEQSLIKGVLNYPELLSHVASSGKGSFGEIIEVLDKARLALSSVHGDAYAYQVMEHMAALTIAYFKKDTIAKPLFGVMGMGRRNSMAAEWAGRSTAVWEWDVRDIDNFIVALETHRILPKQPYDTAKSGATHIDMVHRYIKLPWKKEPVALPSTFDMRKPDYNWYSMRLRKESGADMKQIAWESIYSLSPYLIAFILWKFMSDALKDMGGKKQ